MSFHYQFRETYKLASYKLFLLKRVKPAKTEFTALTIVKSMLLPYLDMGNMFLSSQTQIDLGKLDVILNTALWTVYNIHNPRDIHMLDIFTRANIFPLKFRRKYFMLNLLDRLLSTGQIDQAETQRVTRHNIAPVLQQYVPLNDTMAKSPTFVARGYWNALPADVRNVLDHAHFKKEEYLREETLRLTAGQFNNVT